MINISKIQICISKYLKIINYYNNKNNNNKYFLNRMIFKNLRKKILKCNSMKIQIKTMILMKFLLQIND